MGKAISQAFRICDYTAGVVLVKLLMVKGCYLKREGWLHKSGTISVLRLKRVRCVNTPPLASFSLSPLGVVWFIYRSKSFDQYPVQWSTGLRTGGLGHYGDNFSSCVAGSTLGNAGPLLLISIFLSCMLGLYKG